MGCASTLSDHGCLFSLDISQHGGRAFKAAFDSTVEAAELQGRRLAEYALPRNTFEISLLQAARDIKQECTSSKGLDYSLLTRRLSEAGYIIQTQAPQVECKCKSKTRKCLEKLTHTYLVCLGITVKPQIEAQLIIEPRLREQFEIAQPTVTYKRLLDYLPGEFVGSASRLRAIVEAMSAAMAEAFKAQDMALPPWRRTSAALSKWNLDASGSPSHGLMLSGKSSIKQPLREQLHNEFNLPVFGSEVFAKASVSKNQRFLTGSPRQLQSSTSGLENAMETIKPKISLLARNLADMAALQKARRSLEGSCAKKNKIKRVPSWDFSGLPPITTVRRSGKVM